MQIDTVITTLSLMRRKKCIDSTVSSMMLMTYETIRQKGLSGDRFFKTNSKVSVMSAPGTLVKSQLRPVNISELQLMKFFVSERNGIKITTVEILRKIQVMSLRPPSPIQMLRNFQKIDSK